MILFYRYHPVKTILQTSGVDLTMEKVHSNYRQLKMCRSYTLNEIADLFSIHKKTIQKWLKDGVISINSNCALLNLGDRLILFLQINGNRFYRNVAQANVIPYGCACRENLLRLKRIIQPIPEKICSFIAIIWHLYESQLVIALVRSGVA